MHKKNMVDTTAQKADAPPTPTPENETLAALARALGHPARLHILKVLHERQTCIGCDIVEEIGLAQSTTSEHLRILKAARIITGEVERPRICYALNAEALEPLQSFLDEVAGQTTKSPKTK